MEIKTKFNLGDEVVFLIERRNEFDKEQRGEIQLLFGKIILYHIKGGSASLTPTITYEVDAYCRGTRKTYLLEECNISENVLELTQKIIEQSLKNIRTKLTENKE